MITCHIAPRVILDFWLETTLTEATLWCKKHSDSRPLDSCEKYSILRITSTGELQRLPGLPTNWGFKLTIDRKIKEVQ